MKAGVWQVLRRPPVFRFARVTNGWRAIGRAASGMLQDRSSATAQSPHRLPVKTVVEIERLRREHLTGPQIARGLGLPRSTVGAILHRLGLGRLSALEDRLPAIRYQRAGPGELIHIDIKKLGRIDCIGHRMTGHSGMVTNRGIGWEYFARRHR